MFVYLLINDLRHCKSVVSFNHVEAFHHTQSILLYGQAARAISIG